MYICTLTYSAILAFRAFRTPLLALVLEANFRTQFTASCRVGVDAGSMVTSAGVWGGGIMCSSLLWMYTWKPLTCSKIWAGEQRRKLHRIAMSLIQFNFLIVFKISYCNYFISAQLTLFSTVSGFTHLGRASAASINKNSPSMSWTLK